MSPLFSFCFLILFSSFIPVLHAACNAGDEKALLAFRNGEKNRKTLLPDWGKRGSSCCTWSGITCQSDRVTSISLATLGLQGRLPRELGDISQLKTLDLSNNAMDGPLPPELGKLLHLELLDLGSNSFSGTIPDSLGLLSNLQYLYIFQNRISGRFPESLARGLTSLTVLQVSDNLITGIPSNMANMKKLESVYLGNNTLSFDAISGLATLPQLAQFELNSCGLKGPIPGWMRKIKLKTGSGALMRINLAENEITGVIPSEFGELAELETIDLHSNKLTGKVPDSIGKLSKLVFFDVRSNLLTGIPANLKNLGVGSLYRFSMSNNKLASFEDVKGLTTLSRVVFLDMSNCGLKGSIPDWFSSIRIVRKDGDSAVLQLDSNQITGGIPANFVRLSQLTHLHLQNNQMSGRIPASLSTIQNLRSLDLSRNRFTGSIPAEFSKLGRLEYFNVASNQLQGKIPAGPPFDIMDSSWFANNPSLCGAPLPACK